MKTKLFLTTLLFNVFVLSAQVGINTTSPDGNSILDIVSTDKGILIPRVILNDASTAAPLTLPITDGILIYSENGSESDGFYYWENNKWNPIGKTPKKTYSVSTSGGNTTIPHLIPSDSDKFQTFDGNWASQFELPNATDSNNEDRLNELITIQKKSSFNVVVSNTNTDMTTNLTLTGTQTAVFMFDGTKWVHIKTSN